MELGEPYVINEKNVEYGVGAIRNILANLEMIKTPDQQFAYPTSSAYSKGKVLKYLDKPFSSKSGIVRFMIKPGNEVKKNQLSLPTLVP